jgi:hypothetical protein
MYAAARDPRRVDIDDLRVVPVELHVTDPTSIARGATLATDEVAEVAQGEHAGNWSGVASRVTRCSPSGMHVALARTRRGGRARAS